MGSVFLLLFFFFFFFFLGGGGGGGVRVYVNANEGLKLLLKFLKNRGRGVRGQGGCE